MIVIRDEMQWVSDIISSGKLQDFIGKKEDDYFDAKCSKAYNLENESGRIELAKDVSSFANSEGGYIVIGLKNDKAPDAQTDIVIDLDLIEASHFDVGKYRGIINEYVFPLIEELAVQFVPLGLRDGDQGVGYIYVPAQSPNHKYFMVKKVIIGGEKIKEIVFGIAQRVGSSSIPFSCAELHRNIQNGVKPEMRRLENIEILTGKVLDNTEMMLRKGLGLDKLHGSGLNTLLPIRINEMGKDRT